MQNTIESHPDFYGFELITAARQLLSKVMLCSEGETVLISADTRSDMRLVRTTAQAAHSLGARPIVVWCATRPATEVEPLTPVAAAAKSADVWIDYAMESFMYTDAREVASQAGVRYGDFLGMNVDGLIRMVAGIDYDALGAMGKRLIQLTSNITTFEIRTDAGTHLNLSNVGAVAEQAGGIADHPGAVISPGGQVTWAPVESSVNGVIVVDGMLWPPDEVGVVRDPFRLTIKAGQITEIQGGLEAELLRGWLTQLNSQDMNRIAHISYGFHPRINRFIGNPAEDERVFGCIDFGFGSWPGRPAPGHFDVVVRSPTICSNDSVFEQAGRYTDSQLIACCRALGVPGY